MLSYDHWLLRRADAWQPVQVAEGQRHSKTVIVRLEGCNDRDQAAELLGCDIAVARSELPDPEQGHYYFGDLEGMKVVDKRGTELGTVAYVMETGANDVLVTKGERERLIPFIVDKIVLDVDLDKGVISVDWEWD